MKAIVTIFSILFLLLVNISLANARTVCTTDWNGIQNCSGPNGTVVRGPNGKTVVVPSNNHRHHNHRHHHHKHRHRPRCAWVNGVQVCR